MLALQGDFGAHLAALARLGRPACAVRRPEQTGDIGALLLPGGESTTLLRHFEYDPSWWQTLADLASSGRPILGTCAGLILLAKDVEPAQRSLGLLDVAVARNAYGRQVDSFSATGSWTDASPFPGQPLEMIFIRAPRIRRVGAGVDVLAELDGEPVLVRQGNLWGAAFHPELSDELSVLRAFASESAESEKSSGLEAAG